MMRSGFVVLVSFSICALAAQAADATSPVDYTQRNTPYAPSGPGAIAPDKKAPQTNETIQERRFETTTVDKKTAPLAERRAPIDMKEARDKVVREKNSHRPETIEEPKSAYNHRSAAISTSADTTKPPTVTRYQDSLTAASASNRARFPAIDHATSAKINRFVFRKNPTDASVVTGGNPVTPAAGGSVVGK